MPRPPRPARPIRPAPLLAVAALALLLSGCAGWLVGQTVDAAIEVAKVPFKVTGAVIDVAVPDDDGEDAD